MKKLVKQLQQDHPRFAFRLGTSHCWSPDHSQISYNIDENSHSVEGLLHELGHARLGHQAYKSDLELLNKEVAAWKEAEKLGKQYSVQLDEHHIQNCLDTYRDWLHKRSMCPLCLSTGIQQNETQYACLNCNHKWRVAASRFSRPYRRSK